MSDIVRGELPFVCDHPGCGRSFSRVQGLGKHKFSAHGAPGKKPQVACPVKGCGMKVRKDNLRRHVTSRHPDYVLPEGSRGPKRKPKIEDHFMQEWTADDIFDSFVNLRYPNGTVPRTHLSALVVWRVATERMLTEINE